jgi:lantibiotic modifying enzyme
VRSYQYTVVPPSWDPIVGESALGDDIRTTIAAIGDDLVEYTASTPQAGWPSLSSGSAGIAAFLLYASRALGREDFRTAGTATLEQAIANLPLLRDVPGLYGGCIGVAWILSRIRHQFHEEVGDIDFDEVDSQVRGQIASLDEAPDLDLVKGLTGVGVYCLERCQSEHVLRDEVRLLVERMVSCSVGDGDTRYWVVPTQHLSLQRQRRFPAGVVDAGMAHGVSGQLAFLSSVLASCGSVTTGHQSTIEESLSFLRRLSRPQAGSWLPCFYTPWDTTWEEARTAWCYGDLGAALAMLQAAISLDSNEDIQRSLRHLSLVAQRPPSLSRVVDACFCHGAAGIAHIFARCYALCGQRAFRDAAIDWLRIVLQQRRPGVRFGGFQFLLPERDSDGTLKRRGDPTLLMGAAGVGLVLCAAIAPLFPWWDGCFQLGDYRPML